MLPTDPSLGNSSGETPAPVDVSELLGAEIRDLVGSHFYEALGLPSGTWAKPTGRTVYCPTIGRLFRDADAFVDFHDACVFEAAEAELRALRGDPPRFRFLRCVAKRR